MADAAQSRNAALDAIASSELGITIMKERGADSLDFHDIAVWSIRDALERAYEAGRRAAPPPRCTCPACGREIVIHPLT